MEYIITILCFFILRKFLFVIYKIATKSKDRSYKDFTDEDLKSGYNFMLNSIKENVCIPEYRYQLLDLLEIRWRQFMNGDFKVDGATFIKEQYGNYFNLWWFNHDARNKFGYVGKDIDDEMLDIMVLLNVPQKHFRDSIWWFKFTRVNWLRHFCIKIFKKGNLKINELPNDLIRL